MTAMLQGINGKWYARAGDLDYDMRINPTDANYYLESTGRSLTLTLPPP